MTQKLYFLAFDKQGKADLWVTDGTTTTAVGGISNVGVAGASNDGLGPVSLTAFGQQMIFGGEDSLDNTASNGIWLTDGTPANTKEVGGVSPGSGHSSPFIDGNANGLNPTNFVTFGNKAIFFGDNAAASTDLWITDGTVAGTVELGGPENSQIVGKGSNFSPENINAFNSSVLFDGFDSDNFKGLWISDGTTASTMEIGGLQNQGIFDSGVSSFESNNFITLGSRELFSAPNKEGDNAVWITDGTANGTVELGGVSNAGLAGADNTDLGAGLANAVQFGARVFFAGQDTDGATGLWTTDGTTSGTSEVGGIDDAGLKTFGQHPSSQGLKPTDLTVNGQQVLFNGEDAIGFNALWASDGTAAGTHEIGGESGAVSAEASAGLNPSSIVSLGNGKAVFIGNDDSNNQFSGKPTLWVTDGTFAGTVEIGGLNNLGVAGINSTGFNFTNTPIGGDGLAYFVGEDAAGNEVLWETDGTSGGTKVVNATDGNAPATGVHAANIALGPIPAAAEDFSGGGSTINLESIPGELVNLSNTTNGLDTVTGSNGTINLTNAQAALVGGGLLVSFALGSGNAVSLSNTKGNKDSVYGAKGTVTLNDAQANVIGKGNTISFASGTSGNIVTLSGSGNSDSLVGFALGDTVEFADIAYAAADFVTYVGNGLGTAGTLSVDNSAGAALASVNVEGSYNPSQFSLYSDGGDLAITGAVGWAHRAPNDSNADGRSDILWRDTSGDTESWFTKPSGGYTYGNDGSASTDWQVAGTGDFNGDGRADILWRNTTSGDVYLYDSNGSGAFNYHDLGAVATSWRIAGVDDFNGDGLADILWRNTATGADELWQTNPSGGFTYSTLDAVSTDWQVAGTGDFNGDGRADILWRNTTTGDTETWFTKPSGGFVYRDDGAPTADWQIAGTGDFNGDGKADILWRNGASGDTYLYNSNSSGGFNYTDLGVVPTSWHIAHTGDFNGDGLSDILWRNTATGDNELWSAKAGGGFIYSNVGNVPTNWTVAA